MELKQLFREALGLKEPWRVTKIEFSPEKRRIDIQGFTLNYAYTTGTNLPGTHRITLSFDLITMAYLITGKLPLRLPI